MGGPGWARAAAATAGWRSEVLRRLTRLLVDPEQPRDLRLSALGAFVATHDAGAGALFRRGLADEDADLRWMACLGLGSLSESGATVAIASHFTDTRREVRWAAALARGALEVLLRALQEADDNTRRAAADLLGVLDEPEAALNLYPLLHAQSQELRNAAFSALARIAAGSGQRMAAAP